MWSLHVRVGNEMDAILMYVTTRTDLENVVLSKRNWPRKLSHLMIPFT